MRNEQLSNSPQFLLTLSIRLAIFFFFVVCYLNKKHFSPYLHKPKKLFTILQYIHFFIYFAPNLKTRTKPRCKNSPLRRLYQFENIQINQDTENKHRYKNDPIELKTLRLPNFSTIDLNLKIEKLDLFFLGMILLQSFINFEF